MQHGDISQGAFALLHEEVVTFVGYERINETHVAILGKKVPYHAREQRPLFVFDGEIPQDGVASATKQAYQDTMDTIQISPHHQRKRRDFQKALSTPQNICRRFLVIPQGSGVGIRFRKQTFAFRYVFFNFQHVEQNIWKFTCSHSTF